MTSPATPPEGSEEVRASSASVFHGLFDRTWELELLISGVVVFGLVQVPGYLVKSFDRLSISLDEGLFLFVWMVYVYLQLAVLAVTAALLVHLLARAYWVGLIGLRSVYPRGVIWRRLITHGPRTQVLMRAMLPSLATLIRRADIFCSSIFSFAFAVAAISVFGILLIAPLVALSSLIDRFFFGGEKLLAILFVLSSVLVVGPTSLPLLDKVIPRRGRDDWLSRVLRPVLGVYYRLLGVRLHNPILLTFQTNARIARFYGLFFAVFIAFLFGFLVHQLSHDGQLRLRPAFMPSSFGVSGMDPRHYDDQRPDDRINDVPSIASDVVDGPFLRLFIPYVPRRDDDALAERCPTVRARLGGGISLRRARNLDRALTPEQEQAARAALVCFQELYEIRLDGVRVAGSSVRFARHPQTGIAGLAARLPVGSLTSGEHILRITRPVAEPDDEKGPPIEYVIPFWRG